jgi:ABC-2 type transport system permease protein
MRRAMVSELVKLLRPGVIGGWLGLTLMFSVIVNVFVFSSPAEPGASGPQPGGAGFPTLAELTASDGFIVSLGGAATLLGVVTLAFWASNVGSDYSSGLIRLMVQGQPHRLRLLFGKVLALVTMTAVVTAAGVVVSAGAAYAMAPLTDVSTDAWSNVSSELLSAWLNVFASCLVWGVLGLTLAIVSRSAVVAISIGVGYVLVVEAIVTVVAGDASDWLPGSILSTVAAGGTATVGYLAALAMGAGYAVLGLAVSGVTFSRRDVTS